MTMIKKLMFTVFLFMLPITGCNKTTVIEDTADRAPLSSDPEIFSSELAQPTSQESETNAVLPSAADSAQICTYEVISAISENMPQYRFVATGKALGTDEWSAGFVTGLDIYNDNNESILSVELTNEAEGSAVYFNMMDTMGLHVTDVNFDGYKDVIILNTFHGAHSNSWYDCWLWDTVTSSFGYAQSFTEICNPAIDRDMQCIYSSGGSGASNGRYQIFRFIDEQFVVTNRFYWKYQWSVLPDEDTSDEELDEIGGIYIEEHQLRNGELETVHEKFYLGEKAGYLIEPYYSEEPWLLSSPRWYMLGGHHADKWLE